MSQPLYDSDAERAVLGSVLLRPDAINELAALRPEYFYMEAHAWTYSAMLAVVERGQPAEPQLVATELRRRRQLDTIGGMPGVLALMDAPVSSHHAAYYASVVIRLAAQRQLVAAGGAIAALGLEDADISAALSRARDELARVEQFSPAPVGAEPQRLADLMAMELPEIRWIIPEILPAGLTLLCGKPKLGKSWLALALGLAVSAGGRAMGHIQIEPAGVLYLALEDHARRLQTRLRLLLGSNRVDNLEFWSVTSWPVLARGGLARLSRWLDLHPHVRLVVIDTIGLVRSPGQASDYASDYAAMRELKALADDRQIAILGVHHKTKIDAEDPLDGVAGSTGLTGAVDGFMLLDRVRGAQEAGLFITGRDIQEEQEIALLWDNVTAQWTSAGNATEYRLTQQRQALIDALDGGPVRPADLADMIDSPRNNVYQLLKRMVADQQVRRLPDGRYSLPDHDHHDPTSTSPIMVGRAHPDAAKRHHDHHDRPIMVKHHDPQDHGDHAVMDHGAPGTHRQGAEGQAADDQAAADQATFDQPASTTGRVLPWGVRQRPQLTRI